MSSGGFGHFVDYAMALEKATYGSDFVGFAAILYTPTKCFVPCVHLLVLGHPIHRSLYDFGSLYDALKPLEDRVARVLCS